MEDMKVDRPVFVKSFELNSPTQMISEHIWGNRYITIREVL